MSLLLIILGAGLVFSLTGRCGEALSRTQRASFFLPPTIVNSVKAVEACLLNVAGLAPEAAVFACGFGSKETAGLL